MIELEVYKKSDFYEDNISSQKEYYECENADAYFAERLAEKDKEIAELKAKLDKKESWVKMLGEGEAALSLELEKTKQKLHDAEMRADIAEAANTEYRIDLKNIKDNLAKHARNQYNKHNRQTLRALWLARAYRAEARKNYWYARCCHEGDERLWSIDGSAVKYIGCIKRTNFAWLKFWSEVECKCIKKAEEYK